MGIEPNGTPSARLTPTASELFKELTANDARWEFKLIARWLDSSQVLLQMVAYDGIIKADFVSEQLRVQCVAELLPFLQHDNQQVRSYSVRVLGLLGLKAGHIVRALAERLKNDPASWIRTGVVQAFMDLNDASKSVVRALQTASVEDNDPNVRVGAVDALAKLEVADEATINLLLHQLRTDDSPIVRESIVALFDRLKVDTRAVAEEMIEYVAHSQEIEIRRKAASVLKLALARGQVIGRESLVQTLLTQLRNEEDSHVQDCAAEALLALGAIEVRVIHGFISQMTTARDAEKRERAAVALMEIGLYDVDPAIEALLDRLVNDPSAQVRAKAGVALLKLMRHDEAIIETLVHHLDTDESLVVKNELGLALILAGVRDDSLVANALVCLRSSQDLYRQRCFAEAIGHLGVGKPEVVDALLGCLQYGNDPTLLQSAAYGLAALTDAREEILTKLLFVFNHDKEGQQNAACEMLGRLAHPGDVGVVDALVLQLSSHANVATRVTSARALRRIGATRPDVLIALGNRVVQDDSEHVRYMAAIALKEAGVHDSELPKRLLQQLEREKSMGALHAIGSAACTLWEGPMDADSTSILMNAIRRLASDEHHPGLAAGLSVDMLDRWPELFHEFEELLSFIEDTSSFAAQFASLLLQGLC